MQVSDYTQGFIALNHSAKIRVKTHYKMGYAATSALPSGDKKTWYFRSIPSAFVVGAYFWRTKDAYSSKPSMNSPIKITSVTYNSSSKQWEIGLNIAVGSSFPVGTSFSAVSRVSDYYTFLSTTDVTWIDVDDPYNAAALGRHSAIDQYLCLGAWALGFADGTAVYKYYVPIVSFSDPDATSFLDSNYKDALTIAPLNRSVKIRGYLASRTGTSDNKISTAVFQYPWLRMCFDTSAHIQYNLRQLAKHSSVGQYAFGVNSSGIGNIRRLHRDAKLRVWDSNISALVTPPVVGDRFKINSYTPVQADLASSYDADNSKFSITLNVSNHNLKAGDVPAVYGLGYPWDTYVGAPSSGVVTSVTKTSITYDNYLTYPAGANVTPIAGSEAYVKATNSIGLYTGKSNFKQLNSHHSIGQYLYFGDWS